MTIAERRWHDFTQLIVCGVGLLLLYMAWFMTPVDEWSIVNHPWQPAVQHLHVLSAPLLVFTVGLLWRAHIAPKLRRWRAWPSRSGLCLLALFLPMAASGYLLQVSVDPAWRDGWAYLHVASSALWTVISGLHVVRHRLAR